MARKGENIYKRKDGRWEGRYRSGCRDDGSPRYRSIYAPSYRQVRERLTACKAAEPKEPVQGSLKVSLLFEQYLAATRLRVKASTYANYRMKANKHLLPFFGDMEYRKLTVQLVHAFTARKLENGLSAKYTGDLVILLKTMSKYTARIYGIPDPIAGAVLPRPERQEAPLYDQDQQQQLLAYLNHRQDLTGAGVLLSLYTGLRIGELCGLRWSDVDLQKGELTVSRTVQRILRCDGTPGTVLRIDTPKSRNSRRSIPLPAFLTDRLRMLQASPEVYVLSGRLQPIEPRAMQQRFRRLLQAAQLPPVRFHSLRHMFATNCIRLGFDPKTLSEILGHGAVETTLNRYVHPSMERKRTCMQLLCQEA